MIYHINRLDFNKDVEVVHISFEDFINGSNEYMEYAIDDPLGKSSIEVFFTFMPLSEKIKEVEKEYTYRLKKLKSYL